MTETKIENMCMKKLSKTNNETQKGEEVTYTAVYENDVEKIVRTSKEVIRGKVGEYYDLKITNPQTELELN